jgi:hypothetical protein
MNNLPGATSILFFYLTNRLLYNHRRDPGEEPKLHLFGQLKRITKQWLDSCLVCKGDTFPELLMYEELADMTCNKITTAITRQFLGERPIKVLLDPYNYWVHGINHLDTMAVGRSPSSLRFTRSMLISRPRSKMSLTRCLKRQ